MCNVEKDFLSLLAQSFSGKIKNEQKILKSIKKKSIERIIKKWNYFKLQISTSLKAHITSYLNFLALTENRCHGEKV